MFTLNCKGQLLTITKPIVMGIINSTPDSFYAGSRTAVDDVLRKAEQMITEGVTIIDVGGQSTRPGSELISAEDELKRTLPAVEAIAKTFPDQIISVDTFYASVAKAAVDAGASIVNDVSGGSMNEDLLITVAELKVPYVLMHTKGSAQTMQQLAVYKNVTTEVFDALNNQLVNLIKMGINDVIIDPGFGFAKTGVHNFELLRQLSFFTHLGRPVLVGLSRKSTVYKTLSVTPEEALNGTTVLHTIALLNGANILRVHDVKEAMQAIKLVETYKEEKR